MSNEISQWARDLHRKYYREYLEQYRANRLINRQGYCVEQNRLFKRYYAHMSSMTEAGIMTCEEACDIRDQVQAEMNFTPGLHSSRYLNL